MFELGGMGRNRNGVGLVAYGGGLHINAAAAVRYEEVKDWPKLPPGVQLGEVAGVDVDANG